MNESEGKPAEETQHSWLRDTSEFTPYPDIPRTEQGSAIVGHFFEEKATNGKVKWLGKSNCQATDENLLAAEQAEHLLPCYQDELFEQLGMQLYRALGIIVPVVRLSFQPTIIISKGEQQLAQPQLYVLSCPIDGFHILDKDFLDAYQQHTQTGSRDYFLIEVTLPDTTQRQQIPLKGLGAMLAAADFYGDPDCLGSNEGDAGYVIRQNSKGQYYAQLVRIDASLALSYARQTKPHSWLSRAIRISFADLNPADQAEFGDMARIILNLPIEALAGSITLATSLPNGLRLSEEEGWQLLETLKARKQVFSAFAQYVDEKIVEKIKADQVTLPGQVGSSTQLPEKEALSLAALFVKIGNYQLYGVGNATASYDHARKILEKYHDSNHWEMVITLTDLANAYGNLGRMDIKKSLLKRALPILEKHFQAKYWERVFTMTNLAGVYGNLGNKDTKKSLLKDALEILREHLKHLDPNHHLAATTLTKLANAYGELDNKDTKKFLLDQALPVLEKRYGSDHWEVAIALIDLANTYGDLGNKKTKKSLLDKALKILEKHFDSKYWEVAIALIDLANAYGELDNKDTKKFLLDKALKILEKHFDSKYWQVAATLTDLANAYGDLGRMDTKKSLLDKALPILEGYFDSNDWEAAIAMDALAVAYGDLHDAAVTEKYLAATVKSLLERALPILEKCLGSNFHRVAVTKYKLACVYFALKQYDQATLLAQEAGKVFEHHYGATHENTLIAKDLFKECQQQQRLPVSVQARKSAGIFAPKPSSSKKSTPSPSPLTFSANAQDWLQGGYHAEGRSSVKKTKSTQIAIQLSGTDLTSALKKELLLELSDYIQEAAEKRNVISQEFDLLESNYVLLLEFNSEKITTQVLTLLKRNNFTVDEALAPTASTQPFASDEISSSKPATERCLQM